MVVEDDVRLFFRVLPPRHNKARVFSSRGENKNEQDRRIRWAGSYRLIAGETHLAIGKTAEDGVSAQAPLLPL
jgi:hypothetical protein